MFHPLHDVLDFCQRLEAIHHAGVIAEIPACKLEVTALSRVYFLGLIPVLEGRRQVVLEILQAIELVQASLGELEAGITPERGT
jgi:hypothetical protein